MKNYNLNEELRKCQCKNEDENQYTFNNSIKIYQHKN